jgi:hypothetical protein
MKFGASKQMSQGNVLGRKRVNTHTLGNKQFDGYYGQTKRFITNIPSSGDGIINDNNTYFAKQEPIKGIHRQMISKKSYLEKR